ncbi:CDK5 regulatory subunit-associated protein 1-like protein [Neoconidiobolus thromboides FSU 785]|nr:CDK5 regulatory subunit-associated protein 1-like protein [Neoconidiobolus thromboides FSU 785]
MNVSDAEILTAVMDKAGYKQTSDINEADVVFLVTCSIRDAAEQKIWHRLKQLKKMKRSHHPQKLPPTIGVLGCMAERLKDKLLDEKKLVDLVCGPDAYRSIPNLLNIHQTSTQGVANVILSADETYADIVPIRRDEKSPSVFVSIMRGCNNMCSYCIVPFTRGIERSRPVSSIVQEVRRLSDQGVKEIVLLGQNVNSYRDTSEITSFSSDGTSSKLSNEGFKTIYKRKEGGIRFAELIEKVAQVDPEMRIRFTSPHPKDFPDTLLHVIRENPNVCNSLHLPAQSGNSEILEKMRRGYTREAYLQLIDRVRELIPQVSISSDFITGFCGETEEQHKDTVSLMEIVGFDMAYMFAYSLREGTHAHRRFKDDVPKDVKKARLQEIIAMFQTRAKDRLQALVGKPQLVLIDGVPHQKHVDVDGNHRAFLKLDPAVDQSLYNLKVGDYVAFMPTSASSTSITGVPMEHTTLQKFYRTYN